MRPHGVILCAAVLVTGCGSSLRIAAEPDTDLTIRWQRLVDATGGTCDRCGNTQEELGKAVQSLQASLGRLGMDVVLEERELSPEECAEDISESNRIWIADRTLEAWIGGEVGKSLCGFCCSELGDAVECRTVTVDGETYEVIPAQLIVKAGLLAASQMVQVPSPRACCPASGDTPAGGPEP
ncbi:MAG: DUF2703 domain-containing protein [Planctomycetota bacterium]